MVEQIFSVKTVASISSWCAQFRNDVCIDSAFSFLCHFSWKVISSPTFDSEVCSSAYGISVGTI